MHSVLTMRGVSFELPNGRELFQDLDVTLGDRLTALVGPNGVGKTTLAKLLSGELEPTRGAILRKGPVTFLPQRQEPEPVSVHEFLGPDYVWSPLGEILLGGIDRGALCTRLSGGQWMRARLARVASQEDDGYLILDEPTNDLDRDGREAVRRFLREHTGGALLISHDRECLELCEETLELSLRKDGTGGLAKFGGGWSAYAEARDREREGLNKALENATRARDAAAEVRAEKLARQEKRNRRGAETAARGGLPKILLGARKRAAQATTGKRDAETFERAQDAARAAHAALHDLKVDPVLYADLVGTPLPAQKLVAEAQGFNVRFAGTGNRSDGDWIYREDLDFAWRGNVRLALQGANGSGKSTLLKALLGALPEAAETRGELRRGKLETLYLDQRCALLDDAKSVFENVRDVSGAGDTEIRNGLAPFLFTKEAAFQKVRDLSGGERLRAALARGFLGTARPELLVLDEPTNNLDLANVEFLEKVVRAFRGALIVISHDAVFLKNCGVEMELVLP